MCSSAEKDCRKKIALVIAIVVLTFLSLYKARGQTVDYNYKAFVTDVYDPDTITVTLDLGFDFHIKNMKIRLYGIDSPETRTKNQLEKKAALKAKKIAKEKLLNRYVVIRTLKDKKGKYGRYLALVYLDGYLFNDWLIEKELVKPYFGKKKEPWKVSELQQILDYKK